MADVSKLKLVRRNNKGQFMRTLTIVDSLLKGETLDLEMLQKYAEKAETQFAGIEEKHAQLIEIIEGETEFENEEKWMAECELDFGQVLLRVRRVVDRQSPLDNYTSTASPPTTPQSNPTTTVPTQSVSTLGTSPNTTPIVQQPTSQPTLSSAPKMERMKFPKFSRDIRDHKGSKNYSPTAQLRSHRD